MSRPYDQSRARKLYANKSCPECHGAGMTCDPEIGDLCYPCWCMVEKMWGRIEEYTDLIHTSNHELALVGNYARMLLRDLRRGDYMDADEAARKLAKHVLSYEHAHNPWIAPEWKDYGQES